VKGDDVIKKADVLKSLQSYEDDCVKRLESDIDKLLVLYDGAKPVRFSVPSYATEGAVLRIVAGYSDQSCGWTVVRAQGLDPRNEAFDNLEFS
jgi:hypothetical protein